MFRKLKIGQKLVVLFLIVGVVPVALVGFFDYLKASEAISEQGLNLLRSVREARKAQVEGFFHHSQQDVLLLSENTIVVKTLPAFSEAFSLLGPDSPEYSKIESDWGHEIANYMKVRGYRDILFADREGRIVYSVKKGANFGKNVRQGTLSGTPLGKAVRAVQQAHTEERSSTMVDFAWDATTQESTAYIGTKVYDRNGHDHGSLIVQISSAHIDEIMQEHNGMAKKTADSYLVGSDNLMRSNSEEGSEITLLKQKVDTVAVRHALNGATGEQLITDYCGHKVLAAYAPIDVKGLDWAIVAVTHQEQLEAPVVALRNWTIGIGIAIAVLVSLLGLFVARSISRPIVKIAKIGKRLAEGDIRSEKLVVRTKDEIGSLASSFNSLMDYLSEKAHGADKISMGDMSVDVTPRGPDDQLGKSFVEMINYLQETVDVSDKIAQGDLMVEFKPRGPNDRLGNAVKNMVANLTDLVAKVQEGAEQVAAASEEISHGSQSTSVGAQQIAEGAERQSSTVQQTSASVQEMSASIEQVSASTQAQNASMQQVTGIIENMTGALQEMAQSARQVASAAQQANSEALEGGESIKNSVESMKQIGQSSEKVAEITGVITDISEQINLLALNAAIEAARAGEHGRGFAVVAEGVTKLAERSQEAAKEIARVIKETSAVVSEGSKISERAGEAVSKITKSVESVSTLIEKMSKNIVNQAEGSKRVQSSIETLNQMTAEITQSAQQQALSASELAKGVTVLSQISEQNASVAEEASTQAEEASNAAEEMVAQAQAMQEATAAFRVN